MSRTKAYNNNILLDEKKKSQMIKIIDLSYHANYDLHVLNIPYKMESCKVKW